jgi:hypothetical protein
MAEARRPRAGAEYDDDTDYKVELARAVRLGHAWLRPSQLVVIRGSQLKQLLADEQYASAINVTGPVGQ